MTLEAAYIVGFGACTAVIASLLRVIVVLHRESRDDKKEINDVVRSVENTLVKIVTLLEHQ